MTSQRFLEIVTTNSDSPRITFNSATGRITLKIPSDATPSQVEAFMSIAHQVKEKAVDVPTTQRTNIRLNSENRYQAVLGYSNIFTA